MNRFFTFWISLTATLMAAGSALGRESYPVAPAPPDAVDRAATDRLHSSSLSSYFQDEAARDSEEVVVEEEQQTDCGAEEPACGVEEESCACEPSCECQNGCGNGCCDHGWGSCLGDCCLGDPWTLQGYLNPCDEPKHTYGGWIGVGYYTDNDPFSFDENDLLSFWDNPDQVNLDQLWFWAEKLADADACSADWGYRFDVVYGVDAQKTQAFGNSGFPNADGWDNDWDHGEYGWAIPQLYGEVAYGDLSVKIGHFFTLIGYEVVPKTGNFFYSHSFTMFNAEPFTHTGVLGTYSASDDLTLYAGWTLGWDTGFDQFEDGSNFLGGFGVQLTDDVKYTYICTAGDLGWREEGYSHSNVLDVTLSENWQYVLHSDYLNTNRPVVVGEDFEDEVISVVNYLFYTLNDCWKLGGRFEWYKANAHTGEMVSYYEITGGVNYHAHANLVLRPEVKYNWTPAEDHFEDETGEDFNDVLFGIDAILTF
jgi:hypothetical protein